MKLTPLSLIFLVAYFCRASSNLVEPIEPGSNELTHQHPVPKTIWSGILNDKAKTLPQPVYPPAARAAGASGEVSVTILVDETGKVIDAAATKGHPLLQAAAVKAARNASFEPRLLSGIPVKVSGTLNYSFQP